MFGNGSVSSSYLVDNSESQSNRVLCVNILVFLFNTFVSLHTERDISLLVPAEEPFAGSIFTESVPTTIICKVTCLIRQIKLLIYENRNVIVDLYLREYLDWTLSYSFVMSLHSVNLRGFSDATGDSLRALKRSSSLQRTSYFKNIPIFAQVKCRYSSLSLFLSQQTYTRR